MKGLLVLCIISLAFAASHDHNRHRRSERTPNEYHRNAECAWDCFQPLPMYTHGYMFDHDGINMRAGTRDQIAGSYNYGQLIQRITKNREELAAFCNTHKTMETCLDECRLTPNQPLVSLHLIGLEIPLTTAQCAEKQDDFMRAGKCLAKMFENKKNNDSCPGFVTQGWSSDRGFITFKWTCAQLNAHINCYAALSSVCAQNEFPDVASTLVKDILKLRYKLEWDAILKNRLTTEEMREGHVTDIEACYNPGGRGGSSEEQDSFWFL